MVVLLVIAILLAIAIPTFLGTSTSAKDRSAQANLNTALVTGNDVFQTNDQSFAIGAPAQYALFAANMASTLSVQQPSLAFTTLASNDPSNLSVSVSAGGNGIVLADRSPSGECWYAVDNSRAISSTVNGADKLRPYGTGTASKASTTSPTTGKKVAKKLFFPSTVGSYYAEVSGDTVAADCAASDPVLTGTAATYQIAVSSFPT